MGGRLVVYYSFSNTTRAVAGRIAAMTGADCRELIPEQPYAFHYNGATREVRREIERGYCPKLLSGGEPVEQYASIFIGTPNWFHSFAPPVLTFLRSAGLSGKTVIPFCTHGGGGFGQIESDMAGECPQSILLPGLAVTADFTDDQVQEWLHQIGF